MREMPKVHPCGPESYIYEPYYLLHEVLFGVSGKEWINQKPLAGFWDRSRKYEI